jgi:hypothetical protein
VRQALIALLLTGLLVAFGSPAQACEHMSDAAAITTSTPEAAAIPTAPEPCPPGSACKLHACCLFAMVMLPQSEAKSLDYKPASFAPARTRSLSPAPLSTLDKPPKDKA